jgi:hypothetical protein
LDIHNMNKIQEPKIRFISKKNHFEIFKWICPYQKSDLLKKT